GWNGTAALNDSWIYSGLSGRWNAFSAPGLTPTPPPLFGARMAFDPSSGMVLLYGGASSSGGVSDELWGHREPLPVGPALWNELASGPSAEYDGGVTFDVGLHELVVYGGISSQGSSSDLMQLYHPSSNAWSKAVPGPGLLGPRFGEALLFDPVAGPDGCDLLFGGVSNEVSDLGSRGVASAPGGSGLAQSDLWCYGLSGWSDASYFT
ncbi:MAG: hypothetical protein ACREC5_00910, partial [Thermoplasmata archaeon]